MKLLKIILISMLITSLFLPAVAAKRAARKSMKELTDLNSPSYVPFPYPKTRDELIADIKFYYVDLTADSKSAFVGGEPISLRIPRVMFKKHGKSGYKTMESRNHILTDMFNPDTKYSIGKILKVKNTDDRIPDDYYWLIYVMDQEGDAVMRITMMESGLGLAGDAIDKSTLTNASEKYKELIRRQMHVISAKEVKESFAAALGDIVADSKIIKLERLGFFGRMSDFTQPAWKITLKGGESYYYKESTGTVFRVAKTVSWKAKGVEDRHREHPGHDLIVKYRRNYVPDRMNDKFILLEPVTENPLRKNDHPR